jgi:hypothetical protein
MIPALGTGPTAFSPKIVQTLPVNFQASSSISTPQTLCPIATCLAGFYRINHYVSISNACPGGTLMIHLQYTEPGSVAKTVDLMSSALSLSSIANNSSGDIQVLNADGVNPITYSTTSGACSSGLGSGQFYLILEKLSQ